MQLAAKPAVRKKKWTLDIPEDELRMKLRRRVGVSHPRRMRKNVREPKSTKIVMWDIALLAHVPRGGLINFLGRKPTVAGNSTVGQKKLAEVNRILDLVNGGYITKSQYGVYHFHDEPVVAPVRNMRVNLQTGLIGKEIISPPKPQRMPNFNKLFGA